MWTVSAVKGTCLAQVSLAHEREMGEDPKEANTNPQCRVSNYNERHTGKGHFHLEH